jgi:hypothetical protein
VVHERTPNRRCTKHVTYAAGTHIWLAESGAAPELDSVGGAVLVLLDPHVDPHRKGVHRLVEDPHGKHPAIVALVKEVTARLLYHDVRGLARALHLLRDVHRDHPHLLSVLAKTRHQFTAT